MVGPKSTSVRYLIVLLCLAVVCKHVVELLVSVQFLLTHFFFATCGHQQCEAAHRADPTSTAGHFCAALMLWQFSTKSSKPSAEPTRWANTCSALSMPSATFGQQQCEAAHRASPTSAADRPNGRDEAGRELKHWMLFHLPALSKPRFSGLCSSTLLAACFF